MSAQEQLDALWAEAERRYKAGEPARRYIGGAYPPPAGDGGLGVLPWLTDAEAAQAHALAQQVMALQRIHDAGAHARLLAKHAARRADRV